MAEQAGPARGGVVGGDHEAKRRAKHPIGDSVRHSPPALDSFK